MKLFEETGDVRPKSRQNGPIPLFGEYEQLTHLRLILVSIYMSFSVSFFMYLELRLVSQ